MGTGTNEKRNVVIIGGGIIGSTTAYFLSYHPSFDKERDSITLLEATKIAGGASGKAGGLLALWAYPTCIVPLSYRLHQELAEKHNGASRWGYRALHCGQLDAQASTSKSSTMPKITSADPGASVSLQKRSKEATDLLRSRGVPSDLDWFDASSIQAYEEMGDPSTTAQVHPYQFTTSMASLAEEKGVKIVYGSAKSIEQEGSAVKGVMYADKETGQETRLEADTVILTAGPWTKEVYPKAPIEALRAHSVTIRAKEPVSAYALFTAIQYPKASKRGGIKTVTPEIYARPNKEVYACGEGDHLIPLPTSTDLVEVDESRCQDIVDQVGSISEVLREGEVTARQACYLPNVSTGSGPLVGLTSVKGLVIGAGHTCWGIQNGPGTGKCLSELVWEGKVKSAELGSLDPRRFGL